MKQTFPYYALTSVIDISIFQRLDSLHVTLWIFTALFRCTLYTICAAKCANMLFSKKISRFSSPVYLFTLQRRGDLFSQPYSSAPPCKSLKLADSHASYSSLSADPVCHPVPKGETPCAV